MTLFLRTEKGETILDLEIYIKTEDGNSFVEISSSIDIKNYSLFLLKNFDIYTLKQGKIIADFDQLSELRGWLWEVYFMNKKNTEKAFDNVLSEIKKILINIAKKYNLRFIID